MALTISKNEVNPIPLSEEVCKPHNPKFPILSDDISTSNNTSMNPAFRDLILIQEDDSSNHSTPKETLEHILHKKIVPIKVILGDKIKEGKLRGRKIKPILKDKNGPSFVVAPKKSRHSKYSHDNILRKIKVCFQRFLIHFSNKLIKEIYGVQKFKIRKLSGNFTQNVTLQFNKILLNQTIADILSHNTSMKYSSVSIDQNQKNIKKLLSKPFFGKFFSMTYKEVYQKLFIENDKSIFDKKYHIYMNDLYNIDYVYNYTLAHYENDYRDKILETARTFISYFETGSMRKNALEC